MDDTSKKHGPCRLLDECGLRATPPDGMENEEEEREKEKKKKKKIIECLCVCVCVFFFFFPSRACVCVGREGEEVGGCERFVVDGGCERFVIDVPFLVFL